MDDLADLVVKQMRLGDGLGKSVVAISY